MHSAGTGIPLARVVAVIATLPDGREQIGSGYLVQSQLVLTAAHCAYDKKTGAEPRGLRVVASDGTAATVEGVVAARGLDVSLLLLGSAPGDADLPTLNFARVDRTCSGVLRDCTAIGFPLFQRDPAHSARHTAELHGVIYQTNEHESGRLLMWEPVLTHLELPASDEGGIRAPADSVWGGLSGAAVFHAGRAIGVIVEHHPRQGASAVQLVAFDTLRKRAETDSAARQVADTLDLPAVEQLAVAAAEPVKPLLGLVVVIDKTNGDLPRVRDLDPYELGTTPSDYGAHGTYGEQDRYVARTGNEADTHLRAALKPAQYVILVGPAKVGKTRTAFEAIHATWPDARLAAPTPERLAELADHPRLRVNSDPLVVWLDDLERFLNKTNSLTPAVLTALLTRPGPTVVVATLRQEARLQLRRASRELPRDTDYLLKAAHTITLRSTEEDPAEQAAAQDAYPGQPVDGAGLAERLGYARELLETYQDSQTDYPELHTVVRTAIDWARTGLSRPIPETDLLKIASRRLEQENPAHQVARKKIAAAIKEARKPLGSSTSAALLLTVSLSQPTGETLIRGYRAYDYLVAADDGQAGPPRPVPEQSWQEALARADSNEAFSIGLTADQRGNRPVTISGFERAAQAGEPSAMFNLGVLLATQEPPDLDGARRWYEQAAQAGHAGAMFNLGMLLANQEPPNLNGARCWYAEAALAGEPSAMFNLGLLLEDQGPPGLDHALHWYKMAAQAGHTNAMFNLGLLLADQEPPDLKGARHWWETAAQAGDTDAMFNLGVLLATQEPRDLDGARRWYEKAAQAGHTTAMFALGPVLAVEGHMQKARALLQRVIQAGLTEAIECAAVLDSDPGIQTAARATLLKSVVGGDTNALNFLGILEWRVGDPDIARVAWETSHLAGDGVAPILLRMTS
ncbi:trypsin-like peptidase domain-containing protein [Streptomyces virginiae]|uniref:trypsin-like peptidase domain-containing protein n=1 Tax=Streptomyces virginiae TaxID=1961 RepID=UPI0036881DA4